MANRLASDMINGGHVKEAVPLCEDVMKQCREHLGEDHLLTLASMNNLAEAYRLSERVDEALPLFEEAQKRVSESDPKHPFALLSLSNLAEVYRAAGHREKALPCFVELLKLRRETQGEDHIDTLSAQLRVALVTVE